MAIKINTAYKEILTSAMLNEKIAGVVGGNEKVNGFDVSIDTSTSVTVKPGKAYVNGCSIEETSDTRTISLDENILSNDGIVYIVLEYIHETKTVEFSCKTQVNSNMVKLATVIIKNKTIAELINHSSINTLSTVIGESADLEAQKIRECIPSGFAELGQLDYAYMSSYENKVKISGKSVAYVNGYRVEIPAGTIIDIGKAPEKESREDLLFLEAWKDSDFAKDGKLKWRIRHAADIDFDKVWTQANEGPDKYIGLNPDGSEFAAIIPQGGREKPITHCSWHQVYQNRHSVARTTHDGMINLTSGDPGLWSFLMLNTNEAETYKKSLKTADGCSYAIPMFRLYRKPSCGKSVPFEYSAINPKVNYPKFATLMAGERVERVITENIKGRSLINLANRDKALRLTLYPGHHYNDVRICDVASVKLNTPYTLSYTIKIVNNTTGQHPAVLNHGGQFGLSNGDDVTVAHPSVPPSDGDVYSFSIKNLSVKVCKVFTSFAEYKGLTIRPLLPAIRPINGMLTYEVCDLVFIEGDWTNKEIPTFFKGLKSLGEDDGNLITIKNGVLNDDTYDIHDGNQKLTAFPEVTHVLSGNTIAPTIVASTKKGGENPKPLNKLGTTLTTDGTEEVEFTNIKGKTLQNILKVTSDWIINDRKDLAYIHVDWSLLKPNTQYTYIVYGLSSNKFDMSEGYVGCRFVSWGGHNLNRPILLTTISDPSNPNGIDLPHLYVKSGQTFTSNDFANVKLVMLEGNYTNIPMEELPYIEGIKSVGETDDNKVILTSTGKNLFNFKDIKCPNASVNYLDNGIEYYIKAWGEEFYPKCRLRLKPNTKYTVRVSKSHYADFSFMDYLGNNLLRFGVGAWQSTQGSFTTPNNGEILLRMACQNVGASYKATVYNMQIEEGDFTEYEHYKKCQQDIYLKEPLRSLPNGVCDEIIGNKIIRRIGKVVLNGSEHYHNWNDPLNSDKTFNVYSDIAYDSVTTSINNLYCDTVACHYDNFINKLDNSVIIANHRIHLSIKKDQLNQASVAGIQAWLQQHPTTVYYELAAPIEECLENVYEKESIKTYQLDAPLRSLPNGIKDEIRDGMLIRRCEEIILNGSEPGWIIQHTKNNGSFGYAINLKYRAKRYQHQSLHMTGLHLNPANEYSVWETDANTIYLDTSVHIYTDGSSIESFKATLSNNPIKIIYELEAPILIPLKEVKPHTANFLSQRQFTDEQWLRELPNGIKDTVEYGKVQRRINRLVLNGGEQWFESSNQASGYINFYTSITLNTAYSVNNLNAIFKRISNVAEMSTTEEGIYSWNDSKRIEVRLSTHRLGEQVSIEQFRAWLSINPIVILFQLNTPIREALTDSNYMYYPSHDFNTYCGSMYVGQGRNYIVNENKIPSEDTTIIDTDFRKIDGAARVDDCRYKKCDDGYDVTYPTSASLNLLDTSIENGILSYSGVCYTAVPNGFKIHNTSDKAYSNVSFTVFLKANVPYRIGYTKSGDSAGFVDFKTSSLAWISNLNSGTVFTVQQTGYYYIIFYCTAAHATMGSATFTNVRLTEGRDLVEYTPHIKTNKYFENTDENDIEDLRHQVSLTGFNYDKILNESFDKLLKGEL